MVHKFKYNWSCSKENIIDKVYKNQNIKKELIGNTSENTDEIVFKCKEFYDIEEFVVRLYFKIIEKPIDDYAFSMWTYIQNKNTKLERFHKHLNLDGGKTELKTDYTFVFYLQIPNTLDSSEGDIVFLDDSKSFTLSPNEGDIIFFPGNILHSPKLTPTADVDRISIAGNITNNFSYKKNLL